MNKKILCLAVAIGLGVTACANATFFTPSLKTEMDKVSYAIGFDIGNGFKTQGINVEANQFQAGVQDGLSGKKPAMEPADMQATLMAYQKTMMQQAATKQQALATSNLAASQAYMTKISAEPGVKQLAPGLYYQVLTAGKGKIPTAKEIVTVNYEGTLPNGTVFDSSYKRGQPATFQLNQVIPGWTQAVAKMPVGSTWMIYMTPDLGYGVSAPQVIGPNQALTFKIELLSIGAPKANAIQAATNAAK
ncbi:MAG: FKBP-type peptidyl-prolyl cis-trans isomerase [Gammaproteobacteria bacterium]|nr:FKBP-type peptidyl-prolyl cis-trans isomerase [Gammaproteobacteria bacterium]